MAIFTAFMSGFYFNVGPLTINATQIVLVLLFPALLIYSAMNRKRAIVIYKDKVSLLIYLYAFANFFSSLLFSQFKVRSLKGFIVIVSYVLIFITVRWALKYSDAPKNVNRIMRFNFCSAAFGMICMLISFVTHRENIGVSYGHLAQSGMTGLAASLPSISAFSIEPNLFAIATAVVFALNLAIYLLYAKSRKQLIVLIVLALGIVFSYTRSVYISVVISFVLIVVLGNQKKLLFNLIRVLVVSIILGVIALAMLPKDSGIKVALASRVTTLFDFKKGSGAGRAFGYELGIKGFKKNPLFGSGTLSADTRFYNPYRKIYQEFFGSPGWLNGAFIQALHDTGLIGFLILVSTYLVIIVQNLNLYRKLPKGSLEKATVLGFLVGNFILLITSQLSSTLWISFPYIYWAINLAYMSHLKATIADQRS